MDSELDFISLIRIVTQLLKYIIALYLLLLTVTTNNVIKLVCISRVSACFSSELTVPKCGTSWMVIVLSQDAPQMLHFSNALKESLGYHKPDR